MKISKQYLRRFKLIFWDFDGVIKESLEVKASAFEKLFIEFGENICSKIISHHFANGGISRYKKIPIYLRWCEIKSDEETIDYYCEKFSQIVINKVVDSNWVEGVQSFLKDNFQEFKFIMITATPRYEIEIILKKIGIEKYFQEIFGSEISKSEAINICLKNYRIKFDKALFIGDSESDFKAAMNNNISFLLRETKYNATWKKKYNIPNFKNFIL